MRSARNILVLGASSDIGLALGNWLKGKTEYRVLLAARNLESKVIYADPEWKVIQRLDFLSDDDLHTLKREADDFFKEPFTAIHCVGNFWQHVPLVEMGNSEIRSMMESHYGTFCGVAKALLPLMMKRQGGRLIAFSCNSVAFNYPDMVPFTSAKAAVECAVKCISNEYAPFGISALALALPTIRTAKVLALKGDSEFYMEPEELAQVVLGDMTNASPYTNGCVLKVFKPNPKFFTTSYFERNPRKEDSSLKLSL
jgi:NAD(P)-dependent dehydrogenase (short-subunit alcohol dehydrogenase family)